MEQMFQLKTHGHLSLFEMDLLTAEDRAWWMQRLKKYNEEQNKGAQSAPMPSMPSIPHISR